MPERTDHVAWSARFGWIVGGIIGMVAGFAATYALEIVALRQRVSDPTAVAGRAAAVVVPALFVAGALTGHTLGARSGGGRYKILGVAAGLSLAALGWATLVLAR